MGSVPNPVPSIRQPIEEVKESDTPNESYNDYKSGSPIVTKEEFEMYKKDIMADLRKERDKMEEVQFNEDFDFSKDFSSHNLEKDARN